MKNKKSSSKFSNSKSFYKDVDKKSKREITHRPAVGGVPLQKRHGQNFLRDTKVLMDIVLAANLDKTSSVFEIGCGDGVLTRELLHQGIERLWVFEIDPAWAQQVAAGLNDQRLVMHEGDFLEADLELLASNAPWVLVANLPYHLTFSILHKIHANRHYIQRGVIMIQEEVALKITKNKGRGYGYVSLFFQYYFDWQLLVKVPPESFYPAPKVFSRVLSFVTKPDVKPIINEEKFWKFIKYCFAQPRRTLRNNLVQSSISLSLIPENLLELRAQQLQMSDFLQLWDVIYNQVT